MASQELAGKVCMVTGAGAGIGRATAAALAERGATVIAVVRDAARGAQTAEEIRRVTGNPGVELMVADLSSQKAIHALAAEFKRKHSRLHLLVHQAAIAPSRHQLTEDGVELTMAVNHYACFLLTELLRDALMAGAPSRVLIGTGGISNLGKIHFDDLNAQKAWRPFRVMAQSKLANVLHAVELARRLQGTGVTANVFDPMAAKTDFAKGTGGLMNVIMGIARLTAPPPEKIAVDLVHVGTSPSVTATGRYFLKRKEQDVPKGARDPELAKKFWDLSERTVGLKS